MRSAMLRLSLLIIIACSVVGQTPRTAADYLDSGRAKNKSGDFEGAMEDFNRAIEIDPRNSEAYKERGNLKLVNATVNAFRGATNSQSTRGMIESAISDFTKAIEIDPRSELAYTDRGRARLYKVDVEGAIADFTRAIQINPRSDTAYWERAEARERKGDYEGAIADLSSLIEIKPQDPNNYRLRGLALRKKKDFDGAINDFTQAINRTSRPALFYDERGLTKQEKGDIDGAISDFSTAIESEHQRAAYTNRGQARMMKNDYPGALSDFSYVINDHLRTVNDRSGRVVVVLDWSPVTKAYLNRGIIQSAQREDMSAINDWTQVIELYRQHNSNSLLPAGDLVKAYFLRGRTKYYNKDLDGALQDLDKAILLFPLNAEYYNYRGIVRAGKRDFEGARNDFKSAIDIAPRDSRAYNSLGWLLATCPSDAVVDATKSVGYATKAAELTHWQEPAYLDTLAAAYAALGNFAEAVMWEEKALSFSGYEQVDPAARTRLQLYKNKKPYREP